MTSLSGEPKPLTPEQRLRIENEQKKITTINSVAEFIRVGGHANPFISELKAISQDGEIISIGTPIVILACIGNDFSLREVAERQHIEVSSLYDADPSKKVPTVVFYMNEVLNHLGGYPIDVNGKEVSKVSYSSDNSPYGIQFFLGVNSGSDMFFNLSTWVVANKSRRTLVTSLGRSSTREFLGKVTQSPLYVEDDAVYRHNMQLTEFVEDIAALSRLIPPVAADATLGNTTLGTYLALRSQQLLEQIPSRG